MLWSRLTGRGESSVRCSSFPRALLGVALSLLALDCAIESGRETRGRLADTVEEASEAGEAGEAGEAAGKEAIIVL